MSETITAKIETCAFTNVYNAPNGNTIYYHSLTLSNGDKVSCGTLEKEPEKLKAGTIISFTMGNNGKIQLVNADSQPAYQQNAPATKSTSTKSSGAKTQFAPKKVSHTDFLGYSYSYAKDLVVAGKVKPKDMEDLQRIAEAIYKHIGDIMAGKPLSAEDGELFPEDSQK